MLAADAGDANAAPAKIILIVKCNTFLSHVSYKKGGQASAAAIERVSAVNDTASTIGRGSDDYGLASFNFLM